MSAAYRVMTSRFMMWMAVLVLGLYYLISFTPQSGDSFKSMLSRFDVRGIVSSLHMPGVRLGIDLQGGTYFVLSVQVEKAIENRLSGELRVLTKAAKMEQVKFPFAAQLVESTSIQIVSATEEDARAVFSFVKKHAEHLLVVAEGLVVKASLHPQEEQGLRTGAVDQAVHVLTNRLNGYGVAGLTVQKHGARQVVVQLPGVDDPERVKSLITKTALLEFKIVERTAGSEASLLDAYDGEVPTDKAVVRGEKKDGLFYLVSAYPDMTGNHITDARATHADMKGLVVEFSLDRRGREIFKDLTGSSIGKNMAIVIDNSVYSAPHIGSQIDSDKAIIEGSFTLEEARDLALVLRSGSLQAPLSFEQESRIGASLGQDSIEKGIMACVVALLLVLLFGVVYYRVLGLFAAFALIYNLFLTILLMAYFEWTLTLPGIAGMVLTIGMAIDASILIFERMREELAAGTRKSFRAIVDSGFDGVMGVILDSNITTFLIGFILFKFGGPAVRGFAVTLMTGILATLVTGIFFLRSMINFALDLRNEKPFTV